MTMTTADTGMLSSASHGHDEKKDYTLAMYLIAAVVIGVVAAAVVTMGLGGLILCGVGATWFMLALLVVMTAGG
ncbi:hypothetical protein [Rhodobacter maris]|uniref:Aa3 type cytochrome c oxidase subunit IV n=1 Tax=Rhodobacter maris TaxID=446682 RepID=A0A285SG19_9RHOB|nr:hypothetical protein [Rhodobacter maris]SOC04821.1 hypothetical protein SAMN05877831_10434 [Rhodobacter maris]